MKIVALLGSPRPNGNSSGRGREIICDRRVEP